MKPIYVLELTDDLFAQKINMINIKRNTMNEVLRWNKKTSV